MSDTPPPSDAPPPHLETPAPTLPPPSTAKGRVAHRAWAVWLGVLLVIALALVGSAPYWAPALMPLLPWNAGAAPEAQQQIEAQRQMAQQLAAIQQQLDQITSLNNRVTALEKRPQPDASAAVAPLSAQVQQLATRLDQIDKQLAQLAHDEASDAQSPQRVLMIALAGLGNAISSSRPFAAELASVEALSQSRKGWAASLQPLEAPAKAGIPSTAVLAQRFTNDVAPAILRAEANVPSSQQNLGQALITRLRSLVIVRRVGGGSSTGGNPTDQAVDAAQAALDKGDLAGAVKALEALSDGAATAARPWLDEARGRLDAEQTVAKLSRDLAGDMAAGASGG